MTREDDDDDERPVARATCTQAVRPALPRAGLGRQGDPRDRPAAGRHVPRDRPGPRRADAAAAARGPAACWRSKSIATWPRDLRGTDSANVTRRRRRFPRHRPRRAAPDEPRPLRVVGNLPYNVASPILFKLLELHAAGVPLVDATLMLQREVADRLVGRAGRTRLRRPQHPGPALGRRRTAPDAAARAPSGRRRRCTSAVVRLRFRAPRAAGRTTRRSSSAGAGDLHAAPEDARQRAAGRFRRVGRLAPPEPLERAGIDGRRRPETLSDRRPGAARRAVAIVRPKSLTLSEFELCYPSSYVGRAVLIATSGTRASVIPPRLSQARPAA